ncbi:hypothetical protein TNCV_497041 [Trichonephila clavipes]|nr:hypothetical protein TNCV_497041 [Trichonephila clavipes]
MSQAPVDSPSEEGWSRRRKQLRWATRRQRAGASAQNEWQRGTEANMRKKPKTGEGRGNKRRQSQPERDVGGAKHETGRNGQNDKRHGRINGVAARAVGFKDLSVTLRSTNREAATEKGVESVEKVSQRSGWETSLPV